MCVCVCVCVHACVRRTWTAAAETESLWCLNWSQRAEIWSTPEPEIQKETEDQGESQQEFCSTDSNTDNSTSSTALAGILDCQERSVPSGCFWRGSPAHTEEHHPQQSTPPSPVHHPETQTNIRQTVGVTGPSQVPSPSGWVSSQPVKSFRVNPSQASGPLGKGKIKSKFKFVLYGKSKSGVWLRTQVLFKINPNKPSILVLNHLGQVQVKLHVCSKSIRARPSVVSSPKPLWEKAKWNLKLIPGPLGKVQVKSQDKFQVLQD